jgi:hypothetical protein
MKYFLAISFLLIVYSCTENADKEMSLIPNEYLTPLLDSFNTRNLDLEPSLQHDIILDTVEINGDLKHPRIHAVFPKLSKVDFPFVPKQIDKLIKDKRTDFYATISENDSEDDSGWQNRNWDIWIQPTSLYQTERVISFSLETDREYLGMSTAFEFNVMNYDLENKKIITLKDFFVLNTSADSSFLEKIIGRAMDTDFNIKIYTENGGRVNFSFDDLYVYFYFDKYDIVGWGTRSVKKKYILDHINPKYR